MPCRLQYPLLVDTININSIGFVLQQFVYISFRDALPVDSEEDITSFQTLFIGIGIRYHIIHKARSINPVPHQYVLRIHTRACRNTFELVF